VTVEVVGYQWQWGFSHGIGEPNPDAVPEEGEYAYEQYAYTTGDAGEIPTLVLPVDQTVQFNLYSPDVIHNFGVPSFLMKMDVIPGRINQFQVTPTVEGTFSGKCYELCGTYHSRMLFTLEVVSQEEYDAYVAELEQTGQVSDTPLIGGADTTTQTGLGESDDQEGSQE
jgi:cytochrome c oxidase subunit 2